MGIPITIGVTGHRDIRKEYIPAVRRLVRRELKKLMKNFPDSEFVMLNSIASGADSLCAEEALQLGIKLVCPLPMEIEEYKKDFLPTDLKLFERLLERADHFFIAPHTEPEPQRDTQKRRITDDTINLSKETSLKLDSMYAEYQIDRDYLYRQAGIFVASHCHVLLALWDGEEGSANGCGTAEAVNFMLRKNYETSNYFNPANDGAVIHIYTPRRSTLCEQEERIYVTLLENEKGCLASILGRTNEYNRDAAILTGENKVSNKTESNISDSRRTGNSANAYSAEYKEAFFPIEIKEGNSVEAGFIRLDSGEEKTGSRRAASGKGPFAQIADAAKNGLNILAYKTKLKNPKNHREEVLRQFFPYKKNIPEPLKNLVEIYDTADRLSMKSQKFYLRMLGLMSLFCVILVLCFLLYDELSLNVMLLCYGGILIIYALAFTLLGRGMHHEKYLHYRLLAESLRIQIYLLSAGIDDNICKDFTWTQKHDVVWVKEAVEAIYATRTEGLLPKPVRKGRPLISSDEISTSWLLGQSRYHHQAFEKAEKKNRLSKYITRIIFVLSVFLFGFILLAEFCFPQVMEEIIWIAPVCAWCKVLWGLFSAVTLFVSGYYGNLSYERKAKDHRRMALLFDAALDQYEKSPTAFQSIYRELAREEIIENGNWMSYCSENRPSLTL